MTPVGLTRVLAGLVPELERLEPRHWVAVAGSVVLHLAVMLGLSQAPPEPVMTFEVKLEPPPEAKLPRQRATQAVKGKAQLARKKPAKKRVRDPETLEAQWQEDVAINALAVKLPAAHVTDTVATAVDSPDTVVGKALTVVGKLAQAASSTHALTVKRAPVGGALSEPAGAAARAASAVAASHLASSRQATQALSVSSAGAQGREAPGKSAAAAGSPAGGYSSAITGAIAPGSARGGDFSAQASSALASGEPGGVRLSLSGVLSNLVAWQAPPSGNPAGGVAAAAKATGPVSTLATAASVGSQPGAFTATHGNAGAAETAAAGERGATAQGDVARSMLASSGLQTSAAPASRGSEGAETAAAGERGATAQGDAPRSKLASSGLQTSAARGGEGAGKSAEKGAEEVAAGERGATAQGEAPRSKLASSSPLTSAAPAARGGEGAGKRAEKGAEKGAEEVAAGEHGATAQGDAPRSKLANSGPQTSAATAARGGEGAGKSAERGAERGAEKAAASERGATAQGGATRSRLASSGPQTSAATAARGGEGAGKSAERGAERGAASEHGATAQGGATQSRLASAGSSRIAPGDKPGSGQFAGQGENGVGAGTAGSPGAGTLADARPGQASAPRGHGLAEAGRGAASALAGKGSGSSESHLVTAAGQAAALPGQALAGSGLGSDKNTSAALAPGEPGSVARLALAMPVVPVVLELRMGGTRSSFRAPGGEAHGTSPQATTLGQTGAAAQSLPGRSAEAPAYSIGARPASLVSSSGTRIAGRLVSENVASVEQIRPDSQVRPLDVLAPSTYCPLPGHVQPDNRPRDTVQNLGGNPAYDSDNPSFVFPLRAWAYGHQGRVTVRVQILADGNPGQMLLKQSSGSAILDADAREQLSRYHFKPARKSGQPVAFWIDVPVDYRLNAEKSP